MVKKKSNETILEQSSPGIFPFQGSFPPQRGTQEPESKKDFFAVEKSKGKNNSNGNGNGKSNGKGKGKGKKEKSTKKIKPNKRTTSKAKEQEKEKSTIEKIGQSPLKKKKQKRSKLGRGFRADPIKGGRGLVDLL